jgi:hypothetical protein
MKKMEIFIWNGDAVENNKLLGKEDPECYLSDLFFSETAVEGYYVQKHTDSETKTRNIVMLIGSTTFCSPYTEEKEKLLKSCLI